jgi:hypothetical protein
VPKVAKYSERDTRGHVYVDCSECTRGGNGKDADKCGAGGRIKRGDKGGCFMGTLLPDLKLPEKRS